MRTPLRLAAVVPVVFAATLVACGSSPAASNSSASHSSGTSASATAIPTAAPTATPTTALSSLTCPTESTINADLGLTLAAPTSQPAADLPAGSSGIVCTYTDSTAQQVVVLDIATGAITTSFVSMVEAGEQKAAEAQGSTFTATATSGVGSQAAFVAVSAAANSPAENGILAVSGNTGLVVTVLPPLSQSQLQSFASQLLG
jgi:hypothetical protein